MIVSSGIDSLNGGNGIDVYKIDGGNLSSSSETYIGDEDGKFFLDFDGFSGTSRALYIDPAPESIGGAYWMQLAGAHTNITHLAPSGTPSGEWAPGYVFWNDAAFVTVQTKEPEVENTGDNFSVYFADDRITVNMFSGPQIYLTGFSDLPGIKELVDSGLLSFNTTNHLLSFDLSDYVEDPSNGGSGGGSNSVSGQSGQADSLGIPSNAAASFSVNNFNYSEGDGWRSAPMMRR